MISWVGLGRSDSETVDLASRQTEAVVKGAFCIATSWQGSKQTSCGTQALMSPEIASVLFMMGKHNKLLLPNRASTCLDHATSQLFFPSGDENMLNSIVFPDCIAVQKMA
jgi:hypothetical protein